MVMWVLVAFVWTGSVIEGTPMRQYKDFKQCREALVATQPRVSDEVQLLCWPEVEQPEKSKKGMF